MSDVVFVTTIVFVSTVLAFIQGVSRQPPPCSAVRMKVLALRIYAQVRHLVEQEYVMMLVPRDDDPETAHVKLSIVSNAAVIERFAYGDEQLFCDVVRTYIIRPNGTVERHIFGRGLQPSDKTWCHEQLTEKRLEYLLLVLQEEDVYSPRREVTRPS